MAEPILVPYKSPPDPAGGTTNVHNPLLSLAYHTTLKCVVCVDCQIVILVENLFGHMTNNDHKSKDGSKLSTPIIQANVKEYLDSLDLNYGLVRRPEPGSIVPAYFWLEKPQNGYECTICEDYAAIKEDTLRNHIQGKNGPADKGCRKYIQSNLNWKDLMEPCFVQRFSNNGAGEFRSYFRVHPNISVNTSTQFTDFLSELPNSLKSGASLYHSRSGSIQTKEFDLPPFLAKTKWTEIVDGFSVGKMVSSVSLKSKSDEIFHRLRPMGKKLLNSVPSTTTVPHVILNGLTAYRTKR